MQNYLFSLYLAKCDDLDSADFIETEPMFVLDVTSISSVHSDSEYSLVKLNDEKWKHFPKAFLPIKFDESTGEKLRKIKFFPIFDDDVFVIGFPRSGTTRLQEMVWIILNDFNFQKATEHDTYVRSPFFELSEWSFNPPNKKIANSLEEMPRPRLMKSHLPVQLLPDEVWTKNPKLFYISREVKDVSISFYHYMRKQGRKNFTLDAFLENFLNDTVLNAPYRENLENYLNLPDYSNIMYLTYESMSQNMDGAIREVAGFLGKTVSEENLIKLKEHLRFEKMRDSNTTNNENRSHIRKGMVGDFRNEMPEDFIRRFDDWMAKGHCLNQGFKFKVD